MNVAPVCFHGALLFKSKSTWLIRPRIWSSLLVPILLHRGQIHGIVGIFLRTLQRGLPTPSLLGGGALMAQICLGMWRIAEFLCGTCRKW